MNLRRDERLADPGAPARPDRPARPRSGDGVGPLLALVAAGSVIGWCYLLIDSRWQPALAAVAVVCALLAHLAGRWRRRRRVVPGSR